MRGDKGLNKVLVVVPIKELFVELIPEPFVVLFYGLLVESMEEFTVELTAGVIVELLIVLDVKGCLFSQVNPTPRPTPKPIPIDDVVVIKAADRQIQHAVGFDVNDCRMPFNPNLW